MLARACGFSDGRRDAGKRSPSAHEGECRFEAPPMGAQRLRERHSIVTAYATYHIAYQAYSPLASSDKRPSVSVTMMMVLACG